VAQGGRQGQGGVDSAKQSADTPGRQPGGTGRNGPAGIGTGRMIEGGSVMPP
jgi:hypothetical protein